MLSPSAIAATGLPSAKSARGNAAKITLKHIILAVFSIALFTSTIVIRAEKFDWTAEKKKAILGAMISRRNFLVSLPAAAMAPRLFAQAGGAPIHVKGINHVTLHVSDL